MLKELLRFALRNIRERKLRSSLTGIGVVISVAAIVALLSISGSLQTAIAEQFAKMGANRIFVMVPGGQPGTRSGLTTKDVEVLERMPEFAYVTPALFISSAKVESGKDAVAPRIVGWKYDHLDKRLADYDFKFKEGAFFRKGQSRAVVLGHNVAKAEEFFSRDIHIRHQLTINGEKFDVVGVLESFGNSEDDNQMYMPLETMRELFDKPDEVSFIDATLIPGQDADAVAAKVKRALKRSRNDENFEVMTPAQMLKFLNTILGIVQGVLVSVAAISLLVGAVGIMNSMYTAVLERTKEIGIMKSIGATNSAILFLFIIEAGIIGFVGGVWGTLLGNLISLGVSGAAAAGGFSIMKYHFELWIIIAGLSFATFVGMASGYLPARQAEKLTPVDALRYGK